jgi:hypothetical protein
MEIKYEPHPVTPDRKAELIAQGYRILDAIYAPDDYKPEAKDEPAKQGKRTK